MIRQAKPISISLVLLAALLALSACGKKGAPSPPGPVSDITYPRVYPTR